RTEEEIAKAQSAYDMGVLAVVVVESPKASEKIPVIEQTYSAGAVCLALVNAALAAGWGANWLTGWPSHDGAFCAGGFGLAPGERVAGIIHIGTETAAPPDRPRPDIDAITTWMSE
ncbi:MAG: nitroreductase, partial [Proteobacteria bacterium]|nr:nitroreductase [Pseudomonadota bacterium]